MAEKKAAQETVEEVQETVEGRREIFIPRGQKGEDPNLFVSINGVNYLLPRGKKSLVPEAVAQEVERAWRAEETLAETQERLAGMGQPQ